MERTQHKLEEARFFLGKLEEHYYEFLDELGRNQFPTTVFQFYLSALDIIKIHMCSQRPFDGVLADCIIHSKSPSLDRVSLDTNDG